MTFYFLIIKSIIENNIFVLYTLHYLCNSKIIFLLKFLLKYKFNKKFLKKYRSKLNVKKIWRSFACQSQIDFKLNFFKLLFKIYGLLFFFVFYYFLFNQSRIKQWIRF